MSETFSLQTPLLLADASPCLRYLVLRDLLEFVADDPEVVEVRQLRTQDPLVDKLVALQNKDGSWSQTHPNQKWGLLQETAQALTRLGYFGYSEDFPPVERGAAFLLANQNEDGSWPLSSRIDDSERYEQYEMIPLQTAIPLRGLAACGYAEHPGAERAYAWLLERRLSDGAWPTGLSSGNYGGVAGYRRIAHSRWGCRTNTTEVLRCFALHPERRRSEAAMRAYDLLLASQMLERDALGYEISRMLGAIPSRGLFTYHAQYDAALILDLGWRVGAGMDNERLRGLLDAVAQYRGDYGLWQNVHQPQVSRWLTFDLIRSLSRIDSLSRWISLEPSTPFRKYARPPRRH